MSTTSGAAGDPWTFAGESVSLRHSSGVVTVVEGSSFSLSQQSGDVHPGAAEGLFVLDTRLLSRWELTLDGAPLEPLSVATPEPYSATFVSRQPPPPGRADSTVLVVRRRWVGGGMREDIEVRNFGHEPAALDLRLHVGCDLADLFAVKSGQVHAQDRVSVGVEGETLCAETTRHDVRREARVTARGAGPDAVTHDGFAWRLDLPAGGAWRTCLEVTARVDDQPVELRYPCGVPPAEAAPARRLAAWRRSAPVLRTTDERLRIAVTRAVDDVGSLVIVDEEHPDSPVVAAGAPWFMTLFGRDSLLTSYMSLLVDPGLALGVLDTLARLQGSKVDEDTEEQPGRILHEVRFGSTAALNLGRGHVYYGTADATPLFVMLLGELRRWGLEAAAVDRLLPHADRAVEWIETYGDRDGDGYVEYERMTEHGLVNQGWKDSWDGVVFADGRIAEPPIALAEVQGYVFAAYRARAYFAEENGDRDLAVDLRAKAARLRAAFNRDFWLPDRGWFAMALDGDKRPVDALASNMGHCLWTGIVDEDKAASVARHLVSPEMFSGWGVRTLATSMASYNPLSYHCGSVWPHDNAIVAAGLMRYGFVDEARRVIDGVLDAAAANDGRLPELYAGLDRAELDVPVAYPTSCSPQAWAAATPLSFLRTLLRLEPWIPRGKVWVDPVPSASALEVGAIPLDGARITVRSTAAGVEVSGLSAGVELVRSPRSPTGEAG